MTFSNLPFPPTVLTLDRVHQTEPGRIVGLFKLLFSSSEPPFAKRLTNHFGQDTTDLPTVGEKFSPTFHADLHRAVRSVIADGGYEHELVGVVRTHEYGRLKLSDLVAPQSMVGFMGTGPKEGPVQYVNLSVGDDEVVAVLRTGLFLLKRGSERLAVLFSGPMEMDYRGQIGIDVMGDSRETAQEFIADIRTRMRTNSIYRGKTIYLECTNMGVDVHFHPLPDIDRESIILPKGVLERIERQTIVFSRHTETLLSAGRHLKRGILLHGPPGTGKTLTAMFLASEMTERTVILITGVGFGAIEHACSMARALAPATVILEDVELVAQQRTRQNVTSNSVLFELLNQMDGLGSDVDVVFLLTTNRPDLLEPALASRPGRIDLAVEVPLPDRDCRRRLFELYGEDVNLDEDDLDDFVGRTEGVSAAFIRELVRRATLFAADEGRGSDVDASHLSDACRELLVEGGSLTHSLLGVVEPDPERVEQSP